MAMSQPWARYALVGLIGLGGIRARVDAGELSSSLSSLNTAFVSSDASALRAALPERKKVLLRLPPVVEKDCFVGADQVYYLFQSFFDEHRTRQFALRKPDAGTRTASVRAEWRYADAKGALHSQSLVFTLVEEGDRWVVTEIKARS